MLRLPLLLLFSFSAALFAQRPSIISERPRFTAGMYNHFWLADTCANAQVLHAFAETIRHYNNPSLPPDSVAFSMPYPHTYRITPPANARIGLVIDRQGLLDTFYRSTQPLPAVIRLGQYGWRDDSVRAIVVKSQKGLYAQVENYDIDARCPVQGFSLTWVRTNGRSTIYNTGGSFGESARFIMDRISAGDLLLFREITYRCPGGERDTGARDLIFTVY